jgi:response regulator of citrate/malate metabolism
VTETFAVLVVEDESLIADAHAEYVGRVPRFRVAGVVHGGGDALRFVRDQSVDLILLDFNLPDLHGLEVCRRLRAARAACDVMAVTSNRDLAAVRSAVSLGVVQYLLKPFTFSALRDKLERYAEYRARIGASDELVAQSELDRAFAALRGAPAASLPAGCSAETLEVVARHMQGAPGGVSAVEAGAACGISRVTARRYLEHLTDSGVLARRQRHGGGGRPEIEYLWAARPGGVPRAP